MIVELSENVISKVNKAHTERKPSKEINPDLAAPVVVSPNAVLSHLIQLMTPYNVTDPCDATPGYIQQ